MPLKLIPPGKRKNKYFVVRGRLAGLDIETSTQTLDPASAARFKNQLERDLLDGIIPDAGSHVTFHRAVDLYEAHHIPPLSKNDKRCLKRIKSAVPDKPLRAMVQADFDAAAPLAFPNYSPESLARSFYAMVSAVMHYGYANQWCPWLRLKRPKQKQPETRDAKDPAMHAILDATRGEHKKHLLMMWLFKHGTRIGGALSVECERIDLEDMTYELYVSKSRVWRTFPLDEDVADLLKKDPDMQRGKGKLFPWRARNSVYYWSIPLVRDLGVKFTPHMARHRVGKKLRQYGLRTIMDALGQTNPNSALRYVSSDIENVREALGNTLGKHKLKHRKD